MKKMLVGIFTAALIAIPATAFASQNGAAAETAVAAQAEVIPATKLLPACCADLSAACCNVPGGSSCCN